MNLSNSYIVNAVAESLRNEVLPTLQPNTHTASSIRSCLVLLSYVGERLATGGREVFEDNREFRHLLQDALADAAALELPPALQTEISNALSSHPGQAEFIDPSAADDARAVFQLQICRLIEHFSDFPQDRTAQQDAFRMRMRNALTASSERNAVVTEAPMALVPL